MAISRSIVLSMSLTGGTVIKSVLQQLQSEATKLQQTFNNFNLGFNKQFNSLSGNPFDIKLSGVDTVKAQLKSLELEANNLAKKLNFNINIKQISNASNNLSDTLRTGSTRLPSLSSSSILTNTDIGTGHLNPYQTVINSDLTRQRLDYALQSQYENSKFIKDINNFAQSEIETQKNIKLKLSQNNFSIKDFTKDLSRYASEINNIQSITKLPDVTPTFNKLNSGLSSVTNNINAATIGVSGLIQTGFGLHIIQMYIAPILYGLEQISAKIISTYSEFDKLFVSYKVKSEEFGEWLNKSDFYSSSIGQTFGIQDAAKTAERFAASGVDVAKSQQALTSVMQVATIANADYTETANSVIQTLASMHLNVSQTTEVTDVLINSANESTGPIHWMKFIDSVGNYVGQKGRIPAMLFSLSIDHPSIEEFITVKGGKRDIQNANISVQITEKFYKAVEDDKDWELRFEIPSVKKGDKIYVDAHSSGLDCIYEKQSGKYYKIATHDRKKEVLTKVVKARKLLELLAKNMYENAEPGIQNIDIARKYSNSDAVYDPDDEYDSRIIGTNACSEQYLSRDSLCVLASINVGRFATLKEIYVKQLERIGISVNRFLDNVNECELVYETFATPHQKLAISKLRRTGAGVTNIVGWLFRKNLQYATPEGDAAFEEFMKYYNYWLYVGSEQTGKEKGNFGLFNAKKWKDSLFVSRVIEESKKISNAFGSPVLTGNYARNVSCSSIAPTGTLSLMFRDTVMSYGIEPAFFLYYWKRTRMSGEYQYYFSVPQAVRDAFIKAGIPIPMKSDTILDDWKGTQGKLISEFINKNLDKAGIKFKASTEIDPMDKLEFMSKVMKWVDSSISTTYLLPEGSDWKAVYKFILESHKKEVKSIAAFPDKKK